MEGSKMLNMSQLTPKRGGSVQRVLDWCLSHFCPSSPDTRSYLHVKIILLLTVKNSYFKMMVINDSVWTYLFLGSKWADN